MAIDVRQSRVGFSDRCKWHKGVTNGNQFSMDPVVEGIFYADEHSPGTQVAEQIGSVMINRTLTAIVTPDVVDGLVPNCFVEYNGETWIVLSIQRSETRGKSKQYSVNTPVDTIIQLRR